VSEKKMSSISSNETRSISTSTESTSGTGSQTQNLMSTLSALTNITKMKANIDHYKFSIQKTSDGALIDFELRGEMVSKEPSHDTTTTRKDVTTTSSSSSGYISP